MPSRGALVYVGLLAVSAATLSVLSFLRVDSLPTLALFAALLFWARQFTSTLGGHVRISLSTVIAMATYPVLGMWGAPALLAALFIRGLRSPFVRQVYNVSQHIVCTFTGGLVYVGLNGPVGHIGESEFPRALVAFTAANIVYHLLNAVLLVTVLRLDTGVGIMKVLRTTFAQTALASLGYSYLGLVMAALWVGELGPVAGVLMIVPLLVARWAQGQYAAEAETHEATLRALAQAIEVKDPYTRGHGERVSRAARMLGIEMGWEGGRLEALAEAGLLHDVGKIGVPTPVLQKDGRLTECEYEAIKEHPLHGVQLVGGITFLEDAQDGIKHHHERYDGRGYPSGLKGEQIPVFARALCVADAFDCMTSVRSYRPARPVSEAVDELHRCSGEQFDPEMVRLFVEAVRRNGWEPAPPVVPPADAPVVGYDHDDPAMVPPVGRLPQHQQPTGAQPGGQPNARTGARPGRQSTAGKKRPQASRRPPGEDAEGASP